ncbi:MAG: hypothetical protein NVSMB48_12510 [Marmoricola sp.]
MDEQPALAHHVVLFDEGDARAVIRALSANGFATRLDRLPFAGEDDDEDQPWAVWTDAPQVMLELAADEFDGWVAYEDSAPRAPLDLPDAPKRRHRP